MRDGGHSRQKKHGNLKGEEMEIGCAFTCNHIMCNGMDANKKLIFPWIQLPLKDSFSAELISSSSSGNIGSICAGMHAPPSSIQQHADSLAAKICSDAQSVMLKVPSGFMTHG